MEVTEFNKLTSSFSEMKIFCALPRLTWPGERGQGSGRGRWVGHIGYSGAHLPPAQDSTWTLMSITTQGMRKFCVHSISALRSLNS